MAHLKWILAAAIVLLPSFAVAAQNAPELKTDKEKFSYALGVKIAENFRKQGLDLDPAIFEKAFADSFNGRETAMTDQEMETLLAAAAQEIRKKQAAQQAEKAQAAQKEGEAFLAANKTKEGVVALPSGLQYKILKAGTGEKPTPDDTRRVQLQRHAHQWNRVRRVGKARRAGDIPGEPRHCGLDRGASAHAGGIEVAALCAVQSGLRTAGSGRHRAERDADLRSGAGLDPEGSAGCRGCRIEVKSPMDTKAGGGGSPTPSGFASSP